MKKLAISMFALLFLACQPKNQDQDGYVQETAKDTVAERGTTTESETVTDPILLIRQKVEHINTSKLKVQHTEFMCDEKTKVDQSYEDGQIVKITVDFGTVGDVYAKEDYYYDQGKLIFKYEFVEGGPACEGCIQKHEYRSYIKNDRVIKYLKDKDQQKCRTCSFEKSAKEYRLLHARTEEEVKAILCR